MLQMDNLFPRYRDSNPMVPFWCVTPDISGCIHRFFDTSPISPSGRYLAVFQLPFENRQPEPGEKGNVCIVDLRTGESRIVAETCGWEPQMGANINWGGTDEALFFNDVDTETWRPFAWRLNPLTGERYPMQGTVYHASPDGSRLISATNMTTMRRTQAGYGVRVPQEYVRWNGGAAEDDGFFLTDTTTGESRLIASIRQLLCHSNPPVRIGDPSQFEIYGFHSKFNPQGDRLMLSLRWHPLQQTPRWNTMKADDVPLRFASIRMGYHRPRRRFAALCSGSRAVGQGRTPRHLVPGWQADIDEPEYRSRRYALCPGQRRWQRAAQDAQ